MSTTKKSTALLLGLEAILKATTSYLHTEQALPWITFQVDEGFTPRLYDKLEQKEWTEIELENEDDIQKYILRTSPWYDTIFEILKASKSKVFINRIFSGDFTVAGWHPTLIFTPEFH